MPVKERELDLTLFDIEREKAELIALREECETDEERAAVDAAIREYVVRDVRKVSGIAALLRYFKSNAEAAKAEQERIAKIRGRWEARYGTLKAMVLAVMQHFDLPKLEGATDRFRRQKNPVALEITDTKLVEEKYLVATVTMPLADWKELVRQLPAKLAGTLDHARLSSSVDTVALKAACSVMVKCEDCNGSGSVVVVSSGPDEIAVCPRCSGTTNVPATVPGARLVQGEHLRVE